MTYIFLISILIIILIGITYLVITKKAEPGSTEISWLRSIQFGLVIYSLTMLFGAFSMAIFKNINSSFNGGELVGDIVFQTFGFLLYAVLFSIILVLPVLVLGLKYLSKTGMNASQKSGWYLGICFVLILIINGLMSSFFANTNMLILMSGFSIFGLITPIVILKLKRVFEPYY